MSVTIISTEAASVPGGVALCVSGEMTTTTTTLMIFKERKHDETSESQGLKVQNLKFICRSFFPLVQNVTPMCSQHSIIRRRL